jgi:hypothetical protein
MPYIKHDARVRLANTIAPADTGELNYILTGVVNEYFYRKGHHYKTINDILGALEGAKLEFYRRVVAPYEDTKIKENGDVY